MLKLKKYSFQENPGLVVMGGDSCSKGREFKSHQRILDGHFSHLFVVRIVMFVWKDENKQKRGRGSPIFNRVAQEGAVAVAVQF